MKYGTFIAQPYPQIYEILLIAFYYYQITWQCWTVDCTEFLPVDVTFYAILRKNNFSYVPKSVCKWI